MGLANLGISFQFPLFCQFLILFFYCNKHLTLHMRILAMDIHQSVVDQQGWMSWTQMKVYIAAFFYIIYVQKIYFTNVLIFFVFGNLWIPQIFRNSMCGYENKLSMKFVILQTIHCLYLPMYFKGTSNNFLFMEPNFYFCIFMVFWITLQISILKIQ